MRINRFLAAAGFGSRRRCEDLVRQGKVSINGVQVKDLSSQVDTESDTVLVGTIKVELPKSRLVLVMRKPRGVLSAAKDSRGRKTVVDLAKEKGYGDRIFPVGRLDLDTSGLLILTNDGDLAYRLAHPRFKIEKTYRVTVRGLVSNRTIEKLSRGIDLDGYRTRPCRVILLEGSNERSILEVHLGEGRKRQIKRMFSKYGHEVEDLERIAIADLTFDDLPMGAVRPLRTDEYLRLRQLAGLLVEREEKSK